MGLVLDYDSLRVVAQWVDRDESAKIITDGNLGSIFSLIEDGSELCLELTEKELTILAANYDTKCLDPDQLFLELGRGKLPKISATLLRKLKGFEESDTEVVKTSVVVKPITPIKKSGDLRGKSIRAKELDLMTFSVGSVPPKRKCHVEMCEFLDLNLGGTFSELADHFELEGKSPALIRRYLTDAIRRGVISEYISDEEEL